MFPICKGKLNCKQKSIPNKALRIDGNQWHGLSLQEASCALPGVSAPGAVSGWWPSDTVWTCWAKPQWQRTHLLHCPSPDRKAEKEEVNLSHVLQDLLEKWVTAKGWPASMNTQKIAENVCVLLIRKMPRAMVCKSQASLQNVRRHFKVAELSWHKGVIYT